MALDAWMPVWEHREVHQRRSAAPRQALRDALVPLDFSASTATRALYRLRGLRWPQDLDGFLQAGFVLIQQELDRVVFGFAADVETRRVLPITPAQLEGFAVPRCVVGITEVAILPLGAGHLLVTETRVRCTDDWARNRFRAYWYAIRPFSGLIRREILRCLDETACAAPPVADA